MGVADTDVAIATEGSNIKGDGNQKKTMQSAKHFQIMQSNFTVVFIISLFFNNRKRSYILLDMHSNFSKSEYHIPLKLRCDYTPVYFHLQSDFGY